MNKASSWTSAQPTGYYYFSYNYEVPTIKNTSYSPYSQWHLARSSFLSTSSGSIFSYHLKASFQQSHANTLHRSFLRWNKLWWWYSPKVNSDIASFGNLCSVIQLEEQRKDCPYLRPLGKIQRKTHSSHHWYCSRLNSKKNIMCASASSCL